MSKPKYPIVVRLDKRTQEPVLFMEPPVDTKLGTYTTYTKSEGHSLANYPYYRYDTIPFGDRKKARKIFEEYTQDWAQAHCESTPVLREKFILKRNARR